MARKTKAKRTRPAKVQTKAAVKAPPKPAPLPDVIARTEIIRELELRLKHARSVRQKLRESCQLSHAALQTAKIDELEDLEFWVKKTVTP